MKYTKNQYIGMIKKFNSKSFPEKLKLIVDFKDIFTFEDDCGWCMVTLTGVPIEIQDEIREDIWFEFDGEPFTDGNNMNELYRLAGLIA